MNNNQMQEMMRRQMINNPRQFAQNMLRTRNFENNDMFRNALLAVANDDKESGIQIINNVCQSHNVSAQEAYNHFNRLYGMN